LFFAGRRWAFIKFAVLEAVILGVDWGRESVSRAYVYALVALMLGGLSAVPANATNCLKAHKVFNLSGDSIEYAMTIAPGADCIQGLRASTMQIYDIWVLKQPEHGDLVMVGPGFRYFAKSDFSGTDKFTLVVVGKNLREEGFSTVEVTVSPQDPTTTLTASIESLLTLSAASAPESNLGLRNP
jgi:hypothetical protein